MSPSTYNGTDESLEVPPTSHSRTTQSGVSQISCFSSPEDSDSSLGLESMTTLSLSLDDILFEGVVVDSRGSITSSPGGYKSEIEPSRSSIVLNIYPPPFNWEEFNSSPGGSGGESSGGRGAPLQCTSRPLGLTIFKSPPPSI